jgi:EAL domain-containing protein (putative c-di-GMP-specific phosphodiesterase class I)
MPDTAPPRSIQAFILEDYDFRREMAAQLLDDCGTGFSSMRQLTPPPLGELKIDQDFVVGLAKTEGSGR